MSRNPRAEYQRDYYALQCTLIGRSPRVPVGRAQQHIRACIDAGMRAQRIAEAAGVSESTIRAVLTNQSGTMRAGTAAKILAVRPVAATSVGLSRRLQALSALGWTAVQIADAGGLNVDTVKEVRRGEPREQIRAELRDGVMRAYRALSMTTAPAPDRYALACRTRVTRLAESRNWAPPLAWDDGTIDDPAATPTGAGYVEPTVADQIRELAAMGLTEPAIADRLRAKPSTVQRTLERSKERDAA